MPFLLDTNACLWVCYEFDLLSRNARAILTDEQSSLYFSSISIAEIAIKRSIGKLSLPHSLQEFQIELASALKVNPLSWDFPEANLLETLPLIHKDPFDRMLICQAMVHGLTIVTPDQAIAQYSQISCVW
jgi:PIN domain nuclease of toxin-antitoxin system